MKYHIKKIVIIILLLLLISATAVILLYAANKNKNAAAKPSAASPGLFIPGNNHNEPQKLELERYRNSFDEIFSETENSADSTLAKNIQKCAATMLKAVLPEKSALTAPLDVVLIDNHRASVTCRAIIFAAGETAERILQCKVTVNYLSDGSCEAEYPEFFSNK